MRPISAKFRHANEGDRWRDGEPPWPRNSDFVDRDRELELLWQALKPQRGPRKEYLVSGAAGIGKTQVALEFAYRYGNKFSQCSWMESNSLLSPPVPYQGVQLVIVDQVEASLDSADWRERMEHLPSQHISVLITARSAVADAQLTLDGLPEEDAVKWLADALPDSARDWYSTALQKLCQLVQYLPFPLYVIRRVLGRSYRSPTEVLSRIVELGPRSWVTREIERDPSLCYCSIASLPSALEVLR